MDLLGILLDWTQRYHTAFSESTEEKKKRNITQMEDKEFPKQRV